MSKGCSRDKKTHQSATPLSKSKTHLFFFSTQAAPPESRAPYGEARLALALEGIHPLSRDQVWAEALDADGKRDSCSTSYDEYLDAGVCDELFSDAREQIKKDVTHAFPSHPRFVRALRPLQQFNYGQNGSQHGSGLFKGLGRTLSREFRHSERDDTSSECGSSNSESFASCASQTSRHDGSVASDKITEYCLLDPLERVLAAHAVRSPNGHSQTACTVAGVLLLVTENEELTFWMLTCFAEDLVPWLFGGSQTQFLAELNAFDKAVSLKMPSLAKTFKKASVRPSLVCAGFFAKLGACTVPGEAVHRLWDALILEGGDLVTHVALSFLKAEEDAIVEQTGGEAGVGGTANIGNTQTGAALLDAAEERFSARFETDDVLAEAIFAARDARVHPHWLAIRADARQEIATRLASITSFKVLRRGFREQSVAAEKSVADGFQNFVSLDVFDLLVSESFVTEAHQAVDSVRAAFLKASSDAVHGTTYNAWLDSCSKSDDHALVAAVRLTSHGEDGVSIESATRAFLRDESNASPLSSPGRSFFGAPNPSRLASAVHTARAATMSVKAGGADASAAALESAMLFGRGGEWWLESVRGSARGAVVLASVVAAVTAATCVSPAVQSDTTPYEVSLASTRDVVPSMGSLFTWPPQTPHTKYSAIVRVSGKAPRRVTKRYSDFRFLHYAAEREGVCLAVGNALALPTGGVSEWSSDPDVVIQRRVQLQRYLDVLAASGCPAATRLLAAFLSDGKESDNETETFCPKTLVRRSSLEKCRKVRGACALHAMTCGPNAFIERASIAVW